jgi:hypothetical protein
MMENAVQGRFMKLAGVFHEGFRGVGQNQEVRCFVNAIISAELRSKIMNPLAGSFLPGLTP